MSQTGRGVVQLDQTHDINLESWEPSARDHPDFPIQNLPFGMFDPGTSAGRYGPGPRGGIRIGEQIVDLRALVESGILTGSAQTAATAAATSLNDLFALGAGPRKALRTQVSALLSGAAHRQPMADMLFPVAEATVALPATIGDYTDFYVGINHAMNVGKLFRPDNPLLPNYKWVPIGYHGRASSIHVSGEPFTRPRGQIKKPDRDTPTYAASQNLDFELEIGVWIGAGNLAGQPISIGAAPAHVAGYCLLNDWSARDIQSWESQPLGPFLSKNFHSTVSAWVITPEALAPYRAPMGRPGGDPEPLPYLSDPDDQASGGLDIDLEVLLSSAIMRAKGIPPQRLSRSSTKRMYWSTAQLIAHHTSGGCDLRPGDLLGSGTLSGPTLDSYGSLLEISRGGRDRVELASGETRTFLLDGDEILLQARAQRPGAAPIGFGECRAIVQPAAGTAPAVSI